MERLERTEGPCAACRLRLRAEVEAVTREHATEAMLRGGAVSGELADVLSALGRRWQTALEAEGREAAIAELRRLRSDLGGGGGDAA